MIQQTLKERAVYIFIAVFGFLSSIATIFFTMSEEISIKWFFAGTLIALTIIVILIRTIFILVNIKNINQSIKLVKHIKANNTLILKSNIELPLNSVLVIYKKNGEYEERHAIGYVENIQENKLIAVKITKSFMDSSFNVKNLIIKTTLSNAILKLKETYNE